MAALSMTATSAGVEAQKSDGRKPGPKSLMAGS
jgi:hypothetical protein